MMQDPWSDGQYLMPFMDMPKDNFLRNAALILGTIAAVLVGSLAYVWS